jgi:hypothetical protein
VSAVTCRACCPSCGLHFASNGAFDLHLSAKAEGHRDPREVTSKDGAPRLAVKSAAGECRLGFGVLRSVVIWEAAGSRERLAARMAAGKPVASRQEATA